MMRKPETVLVIERERRWRDRLADPLRFLGYEAWFSASYDEGRARATRDQPRAVLIYLEVVDQEAVELVQDLRASFPHMAIAALIEGDVDQTVAAARAAGFTLTEYFVEPVQFAALKDWLEAASENGAGA